MLDKILRRALTVNLGLSLAGVRICWIHEVLAKFGGSRDFVLVLICELTSGIYFLFMIDSELCSPGYLLLSEACAHKAILR